MPKKSGFDDLPLSIRLNPKRQKDQVASLRKVRLSNAKSNRGSAKNRGPIRGASAPATRSKNPLLSRRVTVKARVVKMTSYGVGAAKLHLRYLDREGTEKDQKKEGFYDQERSEISRKDINAIKEGEPHQFRFIVSPEDAERLNLTEYTKSLMSQMESDLGRELDWKAINHYNTDNPHTHVVVHGLDKKGKELFIDKEYISNGLRNRASELVTQELGHRMEHEIKTSLQKEIKTKALTRIDYQLIDKAVDQKIELKPYGDTPAVRLQRSTMIGRLTELERMGLAEKLGSNQWRLHDNLKQKLNSLNHYSEAVSRLQAAEKNLATPANDHLVYDVQSEEKLDGIVVDRGIRNEMSDKGYFIVGDRQGALNYIEVGSLNQYENIPINSIVSVQVESQSWVRKSDRNISDYAQSHAGKLKPKSFGEWAVSHGKVSHGKLSDFINTHEKRLQTLKRYDLVQKAGENWEIPNNLIDQLEQKSANPRAAIKLQHSLRLDEQVSYKGRTYLDNHYHEFFDNKNPDGISIKLNNSARLRAQWLQKQGLEAGTQTSRNVLDSLERNTLADAIHNKTGLSFKSLSKNESFQGETVGVIATKSVRRYIVIANEKEFSMVPWKSPYSPEKGQPMAIGINQQGRTWTKQIQRGLER